ncbi:MAG TPA: hypothetical protein VFL38_13435, partial [Humibacillus xanthopallidus]|nr:hypothetical protein [Humibacillus xanthopallidus]
MQSDSDTSPSPETSTATSTATSTVVAPRCLDGRMLAVDAFADPLDVQIPPGDAVVDGDPTAAVSVLGEVGRVDLVGRARGVDETGAAGESAAAEVGVWEMTPGTATDVEADEVFVVLSGRATL